MTHPPLHFFLGSINSLIDEQKRVVNVNLYRMEGLPVGPGPFRKMSKVIFKFLRLTCLTIESGLVWDVII